MPKPKAPKILIPDSILQAEFEYLAQSAFQANEDRARVTTFYFISVGSLVAVILGTEFAGDISRGAYLAFTLLFGLLTAFGILTISQLARLRVAWVEAVIAMNRVKDHYLALYPQLEAAFLWRMGTVPGKGKRFSIAGLMAMEVALLGSGTLVASVYCLLRTWGGISGWGWLILGGASLLGYIVQIGWYRFLLNYNDR